MSNPDINKDTIEFLGTEWLLIVISVSILIFLVLFIGNKISKNNKEMYAKILGYIMIAFFIINHVLLVIIDNWEASKELPLHLCSISGLICCVIMFLPVNKRQFLFEFLFYCGIIGGVQAILTPALEVYQGYNYFYVQFFFKHAMIIAFPIYLRNNLGMKLTKFSWLKTFIFLNFLMLLNIQVNKKIGSNFMYVSNPPPVKNPLIISEHPESLKFLDKIPIEPHLFWWEPLVLIFILIVFFFGKPESFEKN